MFQALLCRRLVLPKENRVAGIHALCPSIRMSRPGGLFTITILSMRVIPDCWRGVIYQTAGLVSVAESVTIIAMSATLLHLILVLDWHTRATSKCR